jgi:hypothetical protein
VALALMLIPGMAAADSAGLVTQFSGVLSAIS